LPSCVLWLLDSTSLQVFEIASSYPSSYDKSIIERTMQYIKDRTECFDDYFPCRKKNCKLLHVWNWSNLFIVIITSNYKSLSEQSRK
jgi:hypothetical protein